MKGGAQEDRVKEVVLQANQAINTGLSTAAAVIPGLTTLQSNSAVLTSMYAGFFRTSAALIASSTSLCASSTWLSVACKVMEIFDPDD